MTRAYLTALARSISSSAGLGAGPIGDQKLAALRAVVSGTFTGDDMLCLARTGFATFRTVTRAPNGRLLPRDQWITVATIADAGCAALKGAED